MFFTQDQVYAFLVESLGIEGIHRKPKVFELRDTLAFLQLDTLDLDQLCRLQGSYAPLHPLRCAPGMDVRVGRHLPPSGGPHVAEELRGILASAHADEHPYVTHCRFEMLHPFMDGNGRTGRALWAWQMLRQRRDPFALSFLHRWYYQTLENSR